MAKPKRQVVEDILNFAKVDVVVPNTPDVSQKTIAEFTEIILNEQPEAEFYDVSFYSDKRGIDQIHSMDGCRLYTLVNGSTIKLSAKEAKRLLEQHAEFITIKPVV